MAQASLQQSKCEVSAGIQTQVGWIKGEVKSYWLAAILIQGLLSISKHVFFKEFKPNDSITKAIKNESLHFKN